MARKTVEVERLRKFVNNFCRSSEAADVQMRQGMTFMLEEVLHETGNYRGFRYLLDTEVPPGSRPGVNYADNGFGARIPHPDYNLRFDNTDDTRIEFN